MQRRHLLSLTVALVFSAPGCEQQATQPQPEPGEGRTEAPSCAGLPIDEWAYQSTYWSHRGFYSCAEDSTADPEAVARADSDHALQYCVPEDVAHYYEPLRCEVEQCIEEVRALALSVEAGDRSSCDPVYPSPDSCQFVRRAFRYACSPAIGL